MSERSLHQETTVISDTSQVQARLLQLGLTLELLQEAVIGWSRAALGSSPFGPPTAPGTRGWFAATEIIRESKVTDGWVAQDIRNWPIVVNKTTKVAVTSTSGDNVTGIVLANAQPATKNRKGIVVWDAVKRANEQAMLPGFEQVKQVKPDRIKKKRASLSYITWFLLVYLTPTGARAELSLPMAISGKKIVLWRERLVLPEYTRMPDTGDTKRQDDDQDPPDVIDVPVERKA